MTTIKDRLKLFETNGPPVKAKPKTKPDVPPRNSSSFSPSTQSDVKTDLSSTKLYKKSEILPPDGANDLSDTNNETRQIINVNHSNLVNNSNEIIHSNENLSAGCNIRDRISEEHNDKSDNLNKEINHKPNKTADNDVIIDKESVESTVQGKNSSVVEGDSEESSDKDSIYDFSYEYRGSIYHLPGLENFIIPLNCDGVLELPLTSQSDVTDSSIRPQPYECMPTSRTTDEPKTDMITDDLNVVDVANNLKRTASKRLIEELFNTSVWRNSANYNDNFIFNPTTVTTESSVGCDSSSKITDISSVNSSSPSNDERRKSTASLSSSKPNIRNLFGAMFRSKRGAKKSHEKLTSNDQIIDIYDSDGHEKPTANHSKTVEGDTDSVGQVTKKPLNSIFNRDWLNSLGEGIKKKANVMSELKKVFTHGKTKHLKKKAQKTKKTTSDASSLEVSHDDSSS